MHATLSDVQNKLATIQEQQTSHDASLQKIIQDVQDLKESSKQNSELVKGANVKRARRSPRGLSVSYSAQTERPKV